MPSNDAAPLLSVDLSEDAVASKQVEKNRQIRREAMRRWRADPLHKAMEQKKRREWYYSRQKLQPPRRRRTQSNVPAQEKGVCGFCWNRPAITTSMRLQVCEKSAEGFKEVLIPYCGEC
jgi:hypothetical protein